MNAVALTRRETEVLQLLARGCTYGEVARRLGVSVNTVSTHVKKLYLKLGVHTAAAAVMRAVELRLLDTWTALTPGEASPPSSGRPTPK